MARLDSGKPIPYFGKGRGKQIASTALDAAPHVASLVTGMVALEFASVSVPAVGFATNQLRQYVKKKTGYDIATDKFHEFGIDVNKLTDTSKKYITMYKQMVQNWFKTLK